MPCSKCLGRVPSDTFKTIQILAYTCDCKKPAVTGWMQNDETADNDVYLITFEELSRYYAFKPVKSPIIEDLEVYAGDIPDAIFQSALRSISGEDDNDDLYEKEGIIHPDYSSGALFLYETPHGVKLLASQVSIDCCRNKYAACLPTLKPGGLLGGLKN